MINAQLPVYWYSGLYLQPQHFQSTDLYHSWQHAKQWIKGGPWQFGIVSADINMHSLLDFTVDFNSLELVTPQGIYLAFPGNGHLARRCFRQAWKYRDHPFTVWGALRKLDEHQENVAVLDEKAERPLTRWVTLPQDEAMKDLYYKGPEVAVPRVVYNLRLIWDEERENALSDECFPLFRVRMRDQEIVIDETYAPPGLTLSSSTALQQKIEKIFYELTSRARSLGEFKHSQGQHQREVSNEAFIMMMVMRSLNRTLPLFKLYLETPCVNPWQVWQLLVQLIGELSTFNDDCNHLGEWAQGDLILSSYDHYQLIDCFDRADRVLVAMLNSFALEDNSYQKLERDDQHIYHGKIDRQKLGHASGIYVMLRSEEFALNLPQEDALTSIRLAGENVMESLIQHSLPGARFNFSQKTPAGLPKRSDTLYLHIDTSHEHWIDIEKTQRASFFWMHAPPDMQVQIVYAGVR